MHLGCRGEYFEGHPAEEAVLHFSGDLSDAERAELRRAFDSGAQSGTPAV